MNDKFKSVLAAMLGVSVVVLIGVVVYQRLVMDEQSVLIRSMYESCPFLSLH